MAIIHLGDVVFGGELRCPLQQDDVQPEEEDDRVVRREEGRDAQRKQGEAWVTDSHRQSQAVTDSNRQ